MVAAFGLGLRDNSDTKKLLFEFDEAIHYKYSLDKELPSWNAKTKFFKNTKTNKLRNILYKKTTATLVDSASIFQNLDESTFEQTTISPDKMDSLREAFSVKPTNTVALPSRCLAVYRDVLV